MTAIYQRELNSYYNGIQGYLCGAFLLLFVGIFSFILNLAQGYANFAYVMSNMDFILIVIIPILSMRIISEEKKQKTDQLLYSLPISMTKVVAGKYLAMLTVLILPLLIVCFYPLILSNYGNLSLATAYSSILAFFFLGAALAAIGMFLSSLTENQGISAGICFLVMLVIYFFPSLAQYIPDSAIFSFGFIAALILAFGAIVYSAIKNVTFSVVLTLVLEAALTVFCFVSSASFSGLVGNIITSISLFDRFNNFTYGMFDVSTIVFYITVAGVFLFLTVQAMEKRRWN